MPEFRKQAMAQQFITRNQGPTDHLRRPLPRDYAHAQRE